MMFLLSFNTRWQQKVDFRCHENVKMDKHLEKRAFDWAKANRNKIVKEILSHYTSENYFAKQIIFLSGSPWAGKTEFIRDMLEKWFEEYFIHIDLDDLRQMIPGYDWAQADCFQKWAIRIMEMLLDRALNKKMNIILDGTFGSKTATMRNIERAVKKGYSIKIYYIHFDPILAWKFTLWRELEQQRKVPLKSFYNQYFRSFKNIKKTLKDFSNIEVVVLKKVLTKSWHSGKIYKIRSYREFEKYEKEISPQENSLLLFTKLWYIGIKYRFFIKRGLISKEKIYEQNSKTNK